MHIYGRSVVKANDSWSWPPLTGLRNHPHWTHHTRWDSSGLKQWPPPDNTQHSQQTNIHATGRIRTRNPSKRAAANLRLILRDHWDQLNNFFIFANFSLTFWSRNNFLILAHSVYKMWIIQEPNKLELWNKLHFEEEETESIYHVKNIRYLYLLNKYLKCNFGG